MVRSSKEAIDKEGFMTSEVKDNVDKIVEYLDDQRCKDINVIDVEGRCSWADALVIADRKSVV